MDVILGFAGNIVIDHQHHFVDIDASGEQVCGDNHLDASATESADCLFALLLVEVGVDFSGFYAATAQVAGEVADSVLRGCEDDDAFAASLFQDVGQDALLVILIAEDGRLLYLLDGT